MFIRSENMINAEKGISITKLISLLEDFKEKCRDVVIDNQNVSLNNFIGCNKYIKIFYNYEDNTFVV